MYGVKELGIPSVAAFRQNEQADLVEMGWGKVAIDAHAPGHPCFRFSPVVLAYVSNEFMPLDFGNLAKMIVMGNEESDADS